jgi:hypothetical protein
MSCSKNCRCSCLCTNRPFFKNKQIKIVKVTFLSFMCLLAFLGTPAYVFPFSSKLWHVLVSYVYSFQNFRNQFVDQSDRRVASNFLVIGLFRN